MSKVYARYGPLLPWLGSAARALFQPILSWTYRRKGFHSFRSRAGAEALRRVRERLERGETVHVAGIGPGGHNSGVALVRASLKDGIELLGNHEEERYTGQKHCGDFPVQAIQATKAQLSTLGLKHTDIHAWLSSWDYAAFLGMGIQEFFNDPRTIWYISRQPPSVEMTPGHLKGAMNAADSLGEVLGAGGRVPIIAMPHHENHASFSYAASPFANNGLTTMITVLDGTGDTGSLTLYLVENGRLRRLSGNGTIRDSLGMFYSMLSSTQGGWPNLSSEGRYMGAAAWGNRDRLTNPYYRRLRQLFYFGKEGTVRLNTKMGGWALGGYFKPYSAELEDILGPPIPREKMWNPDAILSLDHVQHAEITRERVDKAAAVQLVFEDAIFHVVEHLIRSTGSHQLVLTGGTALNCTSNMLLLEHFHESYYQRYFGEPDTRLHLWVPPIPGDAGAPAGAAFNFLMQAGVRPGAPMRHAYYCGAAASSDELSLEIRRDTAVGHTLVGEIRTAAGREKVADLAARIVAAGGVLGLYQGIAETGPRALGNRSILADPTREDTLETLNARVKLRERIRPLAPMLTLDAAKKLFELSSGAADDDYNAYNYMVLTARAKPGTKKIIPAAVHQDGTGRLQIVREETNPFVFAYLKAMGRHTGVEASINTSLNVGAPIAQTPRQALDTLKRAKGMDGLLMIGHEGKVYFAWHEAASVTVLRNEIMSWLKLAS